MLSVVFSYSRPFSVPKLNNSLILHNTESPAMGDLKYGKVRIHIRACVLNYNILMYICFIYITS